MAGSDSHVAETLDSNGDASVPTLARLPLLFFVVIRNVLPDPLARPRVLGL